MCNLKFGVPFIQNVHFETFEKVPYLRHDFEEEEWKSVARNIVFGWKTVYYFPIQISSVLISCSIICLEYFRMIN